MLTHTHCLFWVKTTLRHPLPAAYKSTHNTLRVSVKIPPDFEPAAPHWFIFIPNVGDALVHRREDEMFPGPCTWISDKKKKKCYCRLIVLHCDEQEKCFCLYVVFIKWTVFNSSRDRTINEREILFLNGDFFLSCCVFIFYTLSAASYAGLTLSEASWDE